MKKTLLYRFIKEDCSLLSQSHWTWGKRTEGSFYFSKQQHLYNVGTAGRLRATVPLTSHSVTGTFIYKGWDRRLTINSQGKDAMQTS